VAVFHICDIERNILSTPPIFIIRCSYFVLLQDFSCIKIFISQGLQQLTPTKENCF